MNNKARQDFVLMAIFVAIIFILGMTPLGMIPLVIIKATIIQIPVIIGSILLGPGKGFVLGFTFGLCSFITNTFTPALLSFAFSPLIPIPGTDKTSLLALVVCFVPRILVGILPYFIYRFLKKFFGKTNQISKLSLALTGTIGSMLNTILVMGLIYLFFRNAYAFATEKTVEQVSWIVLTIIGTNGVIEAILSTIICIVVIPPLLKLKST